MIVEMTVAFRVEVPDDTDIESLSMELDYDTVSIETMHRDHVPDAVVIAHSTVTVEKAEE